MSIYKIENGRIVSPGKFEGEPAWILDLWERVLNSEADVSLHDRSTAFDAFEIDDEIAALTGYRARQGTYVVLWSDDNGFVSHMVMDQAALDALESCDTADFEREEPTAEFYDHEIPGFDDYPEYESGY